MFRKLDFLLRKGPPPTPVNDRPLDASAIESILDLRCAKDSFEVVEDLQRPIAKNVLWRRRRLGWVDLRTGEDVGLCVNEVRLPAGSHARLEPSVAMAHPGLVDFNAIEHAYWQTNWASGHLRASHGRKESRLFVNMRALTCSKSGAPRGPWEDLEALHTRIENGEWSADKLDLIPMMNPQWREVEGTPARVARYLPAHPPSWPVQANESVVAATNGGYFLNFPE